MFKKFLSFVLAAILVFSCVSAFSAGEITLAVNGKKLEPAAAPFMDNGTTMVPVAVILRELGYEVDWLPDGGIVNATNAFRMVTIVIGKANIIVDGEIIPISHAPFVLNGTTFVPVRAVCEMLGCTVDWNGDYRVVNVASADYKGTPYIPSSPVITPPATVTPPTTTPSVQTPSISQPELGGSYIETIHHPVEFSKNNSMNVVMIFDLINKCRAEYNIPLLAYDDAVAAVAQRHSTDMRDYYSDKVSHYTPNSDEDPFDRLDNANILYVDAAEVLASGFTKTEDVVRSWMNSPSHKEVILDPGYTHIGVGYDYGGSNGTYWTVYLISR